MIDLTTEDLIPLEHARRHRLLRTRHGDAAFSTVLGYAKNGIRGITLEHVVKPSGIHTTEAAIIRFIERLTAAGNPMRIPNQPNRLAEASM
jgi:hypothetical protein